MNFTTLIRGVYIGIMLLSLAACAGSAGETTDNNSVKLTSTPSNNQKSVVTNLQRIEITFDQAVDPDSVNEQNLTITPGINYIIDKSLLPSENKVFFSLQTPLANNMTYEASLSGIKDVNGNTLDTYSWSFDTETDATAPSLSNVLPGNNSINIATNINSFYFVFSENMDTNFISSSNITTSPTIDGALTYISSQTIRFLPDSNLASNTAYTLTLSGLRDQAGNIMDAYTLSITTRASQDLTAPSVTSSSPANNTSSIPTDTSQIVINFDEAMNAGSVTSGFSIQPSVNGNGSMTSNTRFVFTPSSNFNEQTNYTVTLSGATDLSGNVLTTYTSSFITADESAPLVLSSAPANNVTDVDISTNIAINFNETMNSGSLTSGFSINPAVTGSLTVVGGNQLRFNPSNNLESQTSYTITISGATDSSGNTLSNYSMSFTTANPTDTTPPSVSSTNPQNQATNVSASLTQITADFNEAIDPTTITSSSFTLNNGLTGSLSMASNNTRAIFTPSGQLAGNATNYTATLNGVTDTAGNPLPTYTWSFTTCGSPTATYTVAWDAVTHSDLGGYRVYYGTSTPLTKGNAAFEDMGNSTSWNFNPAALGFQGCVTVHIAVSAYGTIKGESGLSNSIATAIE